MAVEHQQHHIRRGQRFLAAGNPQLLHRVIGAADAGGVEQGDRHPFQHDLALQQIPGGARQIGHDRPLAAAEPIEQGTFSHVGATHQGHAQALAQGIAPLAIAHQLLKLQTHGLQLLQQGLASEGRQVLLEIHPSLQFGELIEQPFPQRRDLGLNAAIEARHGQLGRPAAAGRHQLTHRLGTGEIEPAVEHGPLAEFARLGPPHSRLPQHLFEHPLHGDHPAMAVDLHHVLTGEAAGPAHQQQQHLIETAALAIDHMAVHHPVRSPLLSARAVHHAAPRCFRSRPGETNHGDPALPWGHGGGHGRNRVGAGHSSRRW